MVFQGIAKRLRKKEDGGQEEKKREGIFPLIDRPTPVKDFIDKKRGESEGPLDRARKLMGDDGKN